MRPVSLARPSPRRGTQFRPWDWGWGLGMARYPVPAFPQVRPSTDPVPTLFRAPGMGTPFPPLPLSVGRGGTGVPPQPEQGGSEDSTRKPVQVYGPRTMNGRNPQ